MNRCWIQKEKLIVKKICTNGKEISPLTDPVGTGWSYRQQLMFSQPVKLMAAGGGQDKYWGWICKRVEWF